jgi:hypothetical protein
MKFQNGLNQEAQIQINLMLKDEIEYKKNIKLKDLAKQRKKTTIKKRGQNLIGKNDRG